MTFWKRWLRGPARLPPDIGAWRDEWARAVAEPTLDPAALDRLRARLPNLSTQDDLEVEREMLDGLEQAIDLSSTIADGGLPAIPTGHRVVGRDACHFISPASMPEDPAQPSGRLILTSGRVIFFGGGRSISAPWHALTRLTQSDRDLVLVRADGSALYRFRCNSYGDALCAAVVARRLLRR